MATTTSCISGTAYFCWITLSAACVWLTLSESPQAGQDAVWPLWSKPFWDLGAP
jgi:hypothetical protein